MENETKTTSTESAAEEPKAGESSVSEKGSNDNSPVTEPKATIKIEGQEFEIEAALAQEDKTSMKKTPASRQKSAHT